MALFMPLHVVETPALNRPDAIIRDTTVDSR